MLLLMVQNQHAKKMAHRITAQHTDRPSTSEAQVQAKRREHKRSLTLSQNQKVPGVTCTAQRSALNASLRCALCTSGD